MFKTRTVLSLLTFFSMGLSTFDYQSYASTLDLSSSVKNAALSFDTSGDYSNAAVWGGGLFSADGKSYGIYGSISTPPSNTSSSSPFMYQGTAQLFGVVMKEYSNNLIATGVSIGGGLGYRFLTPIPTALMLHFQVSPDPLNLYKARWLYFADLGYEAMFAPSFIGYLTYRYSQMQFGEKITLENNKQISDFTLVSDIYLGVKFHF